MLMASRMKKSHMNMLQQNNVRKEPETPVLFPGCWEFPGSLIFGVIKPDSCHPLGKIRQPCCLRVQKSDAI